MSCERMRDRLLEAELPELRGEGDTHLARHVRTCARCRAAARQLLDEEGRLAALLDRLEPLTALPDATRAPPPEPRPGRRRRLWVGLVPALAAAGIAALLVLTNLRPPVEETLHDTDAGMAALPVPAAEGPPGRTVAVFRTANPDIVVIWFY